MTARLVSVVMVICNVERFLVEAIERVLGQTFHDFEFIILDYGSIDRSKDTVLSYAARDSRIKLHSTPPCTYIEAKIAACSLAQGRYIAHRLPVFWRGTACGVNTDFHEKRTPC